MEENWSSAVFFQESSKVKESTLDELWNADTVFLLGGQNFGQADELFTDRPITILVKFTITLYTWALQSSIRRRMLRVIELSSC